MNIVLGLFPKKWPDKIPETIQPEQGGFIFCQTFIHHNFRETNISALAFWRCRFIACSFDFASLSQRKFVECNFERCSFVGTDLTGARLENCYLSQCKGSHIQGDATFWKYCRWKNTDIPESSFAGSIFEFCKWERVDISYCHFKRSQWQEGCMKKVHGDGGDWSDASLQKVRLTCLSFPYVSFHHTHFSDVSIAKSDLSHAEFYECDCRKIRGKRNIQSEECPHCWNTGKYPTIGDFILAAGLIVSFCMGILIRHLLFS